MVAAAVVGAAVVGGVATSATQKSASKNAANAQAASTEAGIAEERRQYNQTRKDLEPYRQLGEDVLPGLQSLVTDPNAQLDYVQNNPFFSALANSATSGIMNNAAARGKVGSGGTAEALQNSLLLLGTDLVNQNVTQRQGLVNIGQNSAAQTGALGAQSASNIANLYTQQGNAQAAGYIGAANAETDAINNVIGTGALVALSDRRAKTDIRRCGTLDNGLPVYTFRYKGDDQIHMNVMAQDVEKVMPEAVIEAGGLKYVDMEKIGGN